MIGELDPSPLVVLSCIDPALVIQRLEAAIDAEHKSPNQMSVADHDQRRDQARFARSQAAGGSTQSGGCQRRVIYRAPSKREYLGALLIGLAIGPKPKANAA
ncbi:MULTISPECIES: hypothetical protein [unclassified Bradyrhizobium]|uniref:hypothetical protein n=1 Tax=unclassified Bradyrhizobium TaxID=2631580 RepID=UPI001FFBCC9D|nr:MULTISPECIES: hypothetical protein [unclassified Bradyrhizobium]MCK1343199.1 hypothetical protein [Bradyrhizobium sp. CW11]MCK1592943.1 hypothetical protein [Bradyrhizobium sp. 169]MCK1634609.1 hypothetical protein [Bradyrhizobium sp. 162]